MHRTLTAHMIVKNEDKWVWFAIMSVIEYVDRMIIFDNGSSDKTVSIIRYIIQNSQYGYKIFFQEKGETEEEKFWKLRQEQIDLTETDYMLVVDGDEIWWNKSAIELRKILDDEYPELVTTHFINCGGDIYHYRDSSRESYQIDGIKGAYTNRVFRMNIDGLHCGGCYGVEGYRDKAGNDIQNNGRKNVFMKQPYLHMSVLTRSSIFKTNFKMASRKCKLLFQGTYDYAFPDDFNYPEVLYAERPAFIADPWGKNKNFLRFAAQLLHDLRFQLDKNAHNSLSGREF